MIFSMYFASAERTDCSLPI